MEEAASVRVPRDRHSPSGHERYTAALHVLGPVFSEPFVAPARHMSASIFFQAIALEHGFLLIGKPCWNPG